jgi:hypothetical protein
MLVEMKKNYATPEHGCVAAGYVADLPKNHAEQLIKDGAAVAVTGKVKPNRLVRKPTKK